MVRVILRPNVGKWIGSPPRSQSRCIIKDYYNLLKTKKSSKLIVFTALYSDLIRFLSGWCDSNTRPPAPKAGAITGLRYTPNWLSYQCFCVKEL